MPLEELGLAGVNFTDGEISLDCRMLGERQERGRIEFKAENPLFELVEKGTTLDLGLGV